MGTESAQVATDGQALADEMDQASQQLTTEHATLNADGVGTEALPQGAYDAAVSFEKRGEPGGPSTSQEVDEMNAAGLTGVEQDNLKNSWGTEPLDHDSC